MITFFLLNSLIDTEDSQETSDEELMRAYQNGQNASFETLLERYQQPIYRFCWRFLQNTSSAEDACQETFLRMIKNSGKWQEKARFKTWLYQIARNYCIDQSRRSANNKHSSLNEKVSKNNVSGPSKLDQLQSKDNNSEDILQNIKLATAISKGLSTLPEEQREVFCLRQYEGFKFKHIADVIGTNESTAKSRMRYALEAMQKELFNEGYGFIQSNLAK